MNRKLFLLFILALIFEFVYSNGVIFRQSTTGEYLNLKSSSIDVNVENQVAITKSTQVFHNYLIDSLAIKYAFPLPQGASATKLRYKINGVWHTAKFAAVPQDTTTGGTGTGDDTDYTLNQYLGNNPLFYEFEELAGNDSTIITELTYVQLLEYKFGKVNYYYPNDYSSIQSALTDEQSFSFNLVSERTIQDILLLSHSANNINNSGNYAKLEFHAYESVANTDYSVQYTLDLDELGLYSLSTFIADSLQKDQYGRGFFAFIVEPDPSENTEVISKVFTLIIDRSGSMSGDKIVQARDAATFITNNLNENDKFNIISFASEVSSFRSSHVSFNMTNKYLAIDYINSLDANGSTNISGAFDMAIPQFSYTDNSTANIIIFFTDGEQTAGITDTDALISHINNLIKTSEKKISLFTFGIGGYTNERLLTSIALKNGGLAEFLGNYELEKVITEFYLMIKNPVLLNTEIEISPSIIHEIYPSEFQNLYKGQQMLLVGRYSEAAPFKITLKGNAFSQDVSYSYEPELSDTSVSNYQFLTKLWAKMKIDELVSQYYLNMNNQNIAGSIKEEVIQLSMDYGVISPFTSFQSSETDNNLYPTSIELESAEFGQPDNENKFNEYMEIISIDPNPCHDLLTIRLNTSSIVNGYLNLSLINIHGQTIHIEEKYVTSNENYTITINVRDLNLRNGIYVLVLRYENKVLTSKVIIE